MIKLHGPLTPKPIPELRSSFICFRHPGYPDGLNNVLLRLNGFDNLGNLHHGTAWLACAIIAGNKWEGYLSTTQSSGQPLGIGHNKVLTRSNYWFHVPDCPSPYPIVPSFQDWQFPHDDLPPVWKHSSTPPKPSSKSKAPADFSGTIQARDKSCRITERISCTVAAHVCPRSEHDWFKRNSMRTYNTNRNLTDAASRDDERNGFLLRWDLHAALDDKEFVIVPKAGRWVVHVIEDDELAKLYHNVPLHDISPVAPEFLLARFAWAIFPCLREFLDAALARGSIPYKITHKVDEHGKPDSDEDNILIQSLLDSDEEDIAMLRENMVLDQNRIYYLSD
jgi:hypothetical protein